MRRDVLQNFLYGECWSSGAWGASTPDRRFLRVSRGGKHAAQDDDGRIVDADGRVLLERSCGVSPVIWRGEELVSNIGCQDGTQGYRYVRPDGSIATGDETYKHPTLPLWEYTDLGDGLLIGQGEDGAVFFDGTTLRMLERGHCTFIRANREGDQVGISFARQKEVQNVRLIASIAELRALPPLTAAPPTELPPIPEPSPVSYPLPADVKSIRDTYVRSRRVPARQDGEAQEAFEDRCRVWVRELAEQIVFSLKDATWGVKRSAGPQSKDAIAHQVSGRLIGYDLLGGVGTGFPTLVLSPEGEDITGQTFILVLPVDHLNGQTPGPLPTPAPTSSGKTVTIDLSAILAPIETKLATMQATIDRQQRELDALKARPADGAAALPRRVALKSAHGRYLTAEDDQRVSNRTGVRDAWEAWDVEQVP